MSSLGRTTLAAAVLDSSLRTLSRASEGGGQRPDDGECPVHGRPRVALARGGVIRRKVLLAGQHGADLRRGGIQCIVAGVRPPNGDEPTHYHVRYEDGTLAEVSELDLEPRPGFTGGPVELLAGLAAQGLAAFNRRERLRDAEARLRHDAGVWAHCCRVASRSTVTKPMSRVSCCWTARDAMCSAMRSV